MSVTRGHTDRPTALRSRRRWCSLLVVPHSNRRLSRRSALAALASCLGLLAVTGCRDDAADSQPAAYDPLEPVLAASVYLADRYQAAANALPVLSESLAPLREAHLAHVTALSRELGVAESGKRPAGRPPTADPGGASGAATPSGSTSQAPLPQGQAAILADLRELERLGQLQAAASCMAGPGYRAELVGSIAAARGSHVEVLS